MKCPVYKISYNISTHYVSKVSDREMQVKKTEIYPITVKIHNVLSSALKKKYTTSTSNRSRPELTIILKKSMIP